MNETQETAHKLLEYVNPPQGNITSSGTRSNNPIAKMTRHKEVMRRVLMGHKIKDIAKDLGYNPASISVLVRTEAFQIELRRMQEIIFEHVVDEMSRFRKLVPFARKFYQEVLADDDSGNFSARLKFDVSKDLLNRVGLKEADQVDVHHDGVIGVGDVASLVTASFLKSQTMDVEAVRLDPEGELEKAERIAGDHQVSGDELAKELKELMSSEIIDVVMSRDDGLSRPDVLLEVETPSKGEEEDILSSLVESNQP